MFRLDAHPGFGAMLAPGVRAAWAFPQAASDGSEPLRITPTNRPGPAAKITAFPGGDGPNGDPLDLLARAIGGDASSSRRGWIGWLSYDLGRLLEPTAQAGQAPDDDRTWPLAVLHRGDAAGPIGGDGLAGPIADGWRLGPLESLPGADAYRAGVRAVLDRIREGDAYQVNLAHRLTAAFHGDPRTFAAALLARARPWFGAYIESPTPDGGLHAVCSISPELFLHFDPRTRRIVTRPMKGTRPAAAPPGELASSAKDRAELTMIIDLMRNDLGRICEPGSVRVDALRSVEHHGRRVGGVQQAVGEVSGIVRTGLGVADILRAAFPPGSVTGAPKLSAMGIIESLEPARRGPYCGAVGWFGDDGSMTLSVAIRTACLTLGPGPALERGGALDYWVGAGVVADSTPQGEWDETLVKSEALGAAAPEARTRGASADVVKEARAAREGAPS